MDQNRRVSTAYDRETATQYDDSRFIDPAGNRIHLRELGLLTDVASTLPKGSKVLEVGCGTGRLLIELARWELDLAGTDASDEMIAQFKEKLDDSSLDISLVVAEAAKLNEPDNKFDFVYSIRLLNQTESPEYAKIVIREMIRVARPSGLVLVEFVNYWRPRKRAKTTRLSVSDVLEVAESAGAEQRAIRGAFLMGMTSYHRSPAALLPLVDHTDRALSALLPRLGARCYVLLQKAD